MSGITRVKIGLDQGFKVKVPRRVAFVAPVAITERDERNDFVREYCHSMVYESVGIEKDLAGTKWWVAFFTEEKDAMLFYLRFSDGD